jgi:retinol dehydrogenase 12
LVSVAYYSNNAGKYADRFAVSEDGVEMTFATNYLGELTINLF